MKTFEDEDEWYIAIKAYKFTIFVLSYIVCLHYPYI